MGSLYHSTSSFYTYSILVGEDKLRPSPRSGSYGGFNFSIRTPDKTSWNGYKETKTKLGEVGGVSLTRSYKTAWDWGGDLVLELDQKKLSHNFKIIPVNMTNIWSKGEDTKYGGSKVEQLFEEMVIGPIHPLSRYLTGIWLKSKHSKNPDKDIKFIMEHPLYKGVRKTDR